MTQLTLLDLGGTLHASAGQLRCERVLANAGYAWIKMGPVGWGRLWAGLQRVVGVCEGATRGAAVRAANEIQAAGAASLAPSLGGMTQLTSLDLGGTLRASAASCAVSAWLRTPAVYG